MSETNKSYRIRTVVGKDNFVSIDTNLLQDYDSFDIMSVSIKSEDVYRLHNSKYGVVVGRVIANNGFGIPNAKISVFIPFDGKDDEFISSLYPFSTPASKNSDGVRYNLLPDEKVANCHQIVGTFPNKRYVLDNDVLIEVFDKYYKYTTRTNNAGDYILVGIPSGSQTLHMDLDLSDCGILSQRPRDFVYKGYTIEQFENPNMFKDGTNYGTLSQVISQDQVVGVKPFWGNEESGEEIGITRADINVSFKFEPTCVFLGSVASDNSSQGIAKGCIPTPHMGDMDELTTGEGKIEMIRKTPGGAVEEFQIRGTQLINGDGIWCYQIPMNLDYMVTDEYGNMVPTDNPEKGIPTRARVRFRLSMQDNEKNVDNYFRPKVLIPHNPQCFLDGTHENYDYEFGSKTADESFRDLFWNNVYSVKSYIPRFQKRGSSRGWKDDRYTGIKGCNFYGSNNPIPYNNIRIKMPFMFKMMCLLVKTMVLAVSIINSIVAFTGYMIATIADKLNGIGSYSGLFKQAMRFKLITLENGLCPDLENWYFAPMYVRILKRRHYGHTSDGFYNILKQTLDSIIGRETQTDDPDVIDDYGFNVTTPNDPRAIDTTNADKEDETTCITVKTDYLMSCIEMNLAQEYKVIKFNFYNDWINGLIYIPRFMRFVRPKKKFLGITVARSKVRGCMDDIKVFAKTRRYTQQCAIGYSKDQTLGIYTNVKIDTSDNNKKEYNKYHKRKGFKQVTIFGKKGGVCHQHTTSKDQYVYYLKPCEWPSSGVWSNDMQKVNLFATDVILLGSLNSCDNQGLPQAFKYLSSSSYIMPTNLALTNMETNGPLYATDKGTMCMASTKTDPEILDRDYTLAEAQSLFPSVQDLSEGAINPLTQELLYLSSSTSPNDKVEFENEELSDYIPMTIAAGISWNYTGPGQGEVEEKELYYPGGHFLGISCTNSQTNVKSCINLERICEVGSTISERKEEVIRKDANGNLVLAYSSPTGFISGEEIINADFRTMFATMNNGRLIANKTNPLTGYKVYDFDYYRPSNFDGAFNDMVRNSVNYNDSRLVYDESGRLHDLFGIALSTGRTDYDINETVNAQNRTRENTSLDYYLFRFGITYEQLKDSQGDYYQQRKFLKKDVYNYLYLPQYENSFYFYFGMHEGATAIDEFNKQFFSECENTTLSDNDYDIQLDGEVDFCTASGAITVTTNGLTTPYEKIILTYEEDGVTVEDTGYTPTFNNNVQFVISGLPIGDYNVTIIDSDGIEVSSNISLQGQAVTYEAEAFNFNIDPNDAPRVIYRGGYIEVSDIEITDFEGTLDYITLVVYDMYDNVIDTTNYTLGQTTVARLFVDREGDYRLAMRYRCAEAGMVEHELSLDTYTVEGAILMDIMVGIKDLYGTNFSLKDKIGYYSPSQNFWFENIGNSYDDLKDWYCKASFFNRINDAEEGTKTTSPMVYTVNGEKVIWGYPQKSDGVYRTMKNSNEEIPAGYTLDDEATYHSTYGAPSMRNYCAVPVNGPFVGAKNYGVLSGGTMYMSNADMQHYKVGYGYVFKPILPDGDIEYYVYDGQHFEHSNVSENGLFFPVLIYPVMRRPFFAEMNFFIQYMLDVEIVYNGYQPVILETKAVTGAHIEGKIYNGVTFENKFSSGTTLNGHPATIEVSQPDTYGLTSGSSVNRVTSFSAQTADSAETYDRFTVSYNIEDGNPGGAVFSVIKNIDDVADPYMFENFSYTINSGTSATTFYIYNPSTNSPGVKYYVCRQGDINWATNVEFIFNDKEAIAERHDYHKDGVDTCVEYFVYCSDNNGQYIVARIYSEDQANEHWYCSYDGNEEELQYHVDLSQKKYDDFLELFTLNQIPLTPVRRRAIVAPTINGNAVSWEQAVNTCKVEEMVFTGTRYTINQLISDEDLFILAEYEQTPTSNPDGKTKIYKIYPYLIKGHVQ